MKNKNVSNVLLKFIINLMTKIVIQTADSFIVAGGSNGWNPAWCTRYRHAIFELDAKT